MNVFANTHFEEWWFKTFLIHTAKAADKVKKPDPFMDRLFFYFKKVLPASKICSQVP